MRTVAASRIEDLPEILAMIPVLPRPILAIVTERMIEYLDAQYGRILNVEDFPLRL